MASNILQLNDRIAQGEGVPEDTDPIATNLSLFPRGFIYIDNNTGELFVRNAENGVAADWVSNVVGIDSVLADEAPLTANREIQLNGFYISIGGGPIIISANDFADNAAALSGGVPSGGLYYTTDGTERILKMAHD